VIIGAALGAVVNSLVNDIIMPPIGYVLGGVDFTQLKYVLKQPVNGDPTTEVAIRWGTFLNALIVFFVVALVVFLIARTLIREKEAEPPEPSDEVKLLTDIRDALQAQAAPARSAAAPAASGASAGSSSPPTT
jgi:large conductance mechanosensitive channel